MVDSNEKGRKEGRKERTSSPPFNFDALSTYQVLILLLMSKRCGVG
jgi:hypothetical protein